MLLSCGHLRHVAATAAAAVAAAAAAHQLPGMTADGRWEPAVAALLLLLLLFQMNCWHPELGCCH
jgi:hypothetical protein